MVRSGAVALRSRSESLLALVSETARRRELLKLREIELQMAQTIVSLNARRLDILRNNTDKLSPTQIGWQLTSVDRHLRFLDGARLD